MEAIDSGAAAPHLMPALHIALVTETFPPEVNGVAMTLGRMVEGLLAQGHRVQLIRPRQCSEPEVAAVPRLEQVLTPGWQLPRYEGLRFGLPAGPALRRLWAGTRPDAVHVATEGPLGWSAVSAARRLGIPVTSDFHTRFDHYSRHYGVAWLTGPVSAYLRRFHNRTAVTFAATAEMEQALRGQGYRRVQVVARGVDTDLFKPSRRCAALRTCWGVGETGLAVVSVGRVAPEKNLPLLLRAFDAIHARRADARLIVVGDGPAREELRRRHPEHHFAGMRSGEDLAAHYASADLFLFPSLTETYGNVTLEAMASGLGVVAYDYAAAAQLIVHGRNGLCAPVADERAFIEQAVRAAGDDALRRRLGGAARQRAQTMTWERITRHFAAVLTEIARAPSGPPCDTRCAGSH